MPSFTNWINKFISKFRAILIHRGKSRKELRKELRDERLFRKAAKGQRIAQYNEMRRKSKKKYRNRRNRKQTRALHQLQRRSAGAY